jgi:hypothetical protein
MRFLLFNCPERDLNLVTPVISLIWVGWNRGLFAFLAHNLMIFMIDPAGDGLLLELASHVFQTIPVGLASGCEAEASVNLHDVSCYFASTKEKVRGRMNLLFT